MKNQYFRAVAALCALALGACATGSDKGSGRCGDGVVNEGEHCDGDDMAGNTCASLGRPNGVLNCTPSCAFDTSGCTGQIDCGNGVKDENEECDYPDMGGGTCLALGYSGGTLNCTTSCTFDVAGCTGGSTCGDGIRTGSEECDATDLGGQTCQGLSLGDGTLACSGDCTFDTSGCEHGSPDCGNGLKEIGEECDASDLAGQTCEDLGHGPGTLACTATCTFDTSGCAPAAQCGNSVIETGEECDDGNTSSGDGCSSTCIWENTCSADETIGCGDTDYGSMDYSDAVSGYNCTGRSYSSGDEVYAFTAPADQQVHVHLYIEDWDDDFDLLVLAGACHPSLCIDISDNGGTTDDITFQAVAGWTYYIVVESFFYMSTWGDFQLSVDCN